MHNPSKESMWVGVGAWSCLQLSEAAGELILYYSLLSTSPFLVVLDSCFSKAKGEAY